MKEQLQTHYLDRYEGVQAKLHQISQMDESSALGTICLGKVERSSKDAIEAEDNFSVTVQITTIRTFTGWYRLQITYRWWCCQELYIKAILSQK